MKIMISSLINGWTIHPFNCPSMQTLAADIAKKGYTTTELAEAIIFSLPIEPGLVRDILLAQKIFDDLLENREIQGGLHLLTETCKRAAFIKKAMIVFNNNSHALVQWYRDLCKKAEGTQKESLSDVSHLVQLLPIAA